MKPTRLVLIFEGQSGRSKQTLLKKKKKSTGLEDSMVFPPVMGEKAGSSQGA